MPQRTAALRGHKHIVEETQSNLRLLVQPINTKAAKRLGYPVWDSTNNKPVWAKGSDASSVWVDATGSTVHTPV